jgi:alpha-1,3/alpha-1,6-mannosyltransferase
MDWLESQTIGQSDVLFVNSKYTESVFRSTFPQYVGKKLTVLYPSLNTEYFDQLQIICDNTEEFSIEFLKQRAENPILNPEDKVYLSINRFEVKKNLELALHAFGMLIKIFFRPYLQFSPFERIINSAVL